MVWGLKAGQMSTARHVRADIWAAIAFLRDLVGMLPSLPRIARTLFLRGINRPDYKRWGNPESLEPWWETRTQRIAALIPKGTRVIEFGAGKRWLESYLDPSCSYIASDLVDRGPGTIVCDLNERPLPDLKLLRPDVAVFVGVLEYIKDLPSLSEWLSQQVSACTASYAYASTRSGSLAHVLENLQRARYGYMNTYTADELVDLFHRCGFACVRVDAWNDQRLFLFQLVGGSPL